MPAKVSTSPLIWGSIASSMYVGPEIRGGGEEEAQESKQN